MSMMGMTAILIAIYFNTIFLILYVAPRVKPSTVNAVFIALNTIFFVGLNIDYFGGEGDLRFMCLDNISPFTFTTIMILPLLKNKVAHYFKCAVAFLSVGMIVVMMIGPQQAYLLSFLINARMDYLLDALCHMNCSLFGMYLVASGQVKLTIKDFKRSAGFLYTMIALVVAINFVFRTNFLGMGPYSKYNIYGIDILNSYWATLLAYVVGVFVVLGAGFGFNYLLNKLDSNELPFEQIKEKGTD